MTSLITAKCKRLAAQLPAFCFYRQSYRSACFRAACAWALRNPSRPGRSSARSRCAPAAEILSSVPRQVCGLRLRPKEGQLPWRVIVFSGAPTPGQPADTPSHPVMGRCSQASRSCKSANSSNARRAPIAMSSFWHAIMLIFICREVLNASHDLIACVSALLRPVALQCSLCSRQQALVASIPLVRNFGHIADGWTFNIENAPRIPIKACHLLALEFPNRFVIAHHREDRDLQLRPDAERCNPHSELMIPQPIPAFTAARAICSMLVPTGSARIASGRFGRILNEAQDLLRLLHGIVAGSKRSERWHPIWRLPIQPRRPAPAGNRFLR